MNGEPTLVDSSNPHYGDGARYYSAVCLETGDVEWVELEENSNPGTSSAFLKQLTERHVGLLNVKWDNARPTWRRRFGPAWPIFGRRSSGDSEPSSTGEKLTEAP